MKVGRIDKLIEKKKVNAIVFISHRSIDKELWTSDVLDDNIKLFISYIVEERMASFGARWMADGQIKSINEWESSSSLDSKLSENYGSYLEFFIRNDLVYESSWTSYGNPREYTLCPSLKELILNQWGQYSEEIQGI